MDEDNYLLTIVRYFHLNPIRAGVIKTVDELDRYQWSGHRVIVGKSKCLWMDIEIVLSQFGNTPRKAINEYRRFVHEGVGQGAVKELTGGGLIRSLGGWSQVLSMRRRGQKEDFAIRPLDFNSDKSRKYGFVCRLIQNIALRIICFMKLTFILNTTIL